MEETNLTPIETEAEETPQQGMRSFLWLVLVFMAFVVGLGAGYLIWAQPLQAQLTAAEQRAAAAEVEAQKAAAQQQSAAAQEQAAAAGDQQVRRYDISEDDDPVLGASSAPITIIEFSDYECPFCRRWHAETFPKIIEKYGDKVRFVYRDFPLYSIHPNAQPAAEAANCAGEQDKYWEFNAMLYESQELSAEIYEQFAGEVGLDVKSFQQCIAEQRYRAEVEADYAYASGIGVRSTPTFFINGLAVVGAQPFDVFERIIDMELAGEIP